MVAQQRGCLEAMHVAAKQKTLLLFVLLGLLLLTLLLWQRVRPPDHAEGVQLHWHHS